jgi:hypothetical protein
VTPRSRRTWSVVYRGEFREKRRPTIPICIAAIKADIHNFAYVAETGMSSQGAGNDPTNKLMGGGGGVGKGRPLLRLFDREHAPDGLRRFCFSSEFTR